MFAVRAVDPQLQAKGGMHSGLMISHCAMIVPNSLLKVPQKKQFCQLLNVVLAVLEGNTSKSSIYHLGTFVKFSGLLFPLHREL